MTTTIQQTIDELRRTLTEYIEATYHIGHPGMVDQRRRLLARSVTSTRSRSSKARHATSRGDGTRTCRASGGGQGGLLQAGGCLGGRAPRVQPALQPSGHGHPGDPGQRPNLMVMTGTGSGKTESFLLPILGKLAIESA